MKFDLQTAGERYGVLEAMSINFVEGVKETLKDETDGCEVAGGLALHMVMAALQSQFGWDGEEVTKEACKIIGMSLGDVVRADDLPVEDVVDWLRQGWMEGRQMADAVKSAKVTS